MIVFFITGLIYRRDPGIRQIQIRFLMLVIFASFILDIAWMAIYTDVKTLYFKLNYFFL